MVEFSSDDDFLSKYQHYHFNEDSEDPFMAANAKRKCISLALKYSCENHNNVTTCHILENKLNAYVDLVDNRSGLNNYAKTTLELLSGIATVSKTWKSGLPTVSPKLNDVLSPLKGECFHPLEDGVCGNSLPTKEELKTLSRSFNNFSIESKKNSPVHSPVATRPRPQVAAIKPESKISCHSSKDIEGVTIDPVSSNRNKVGFTETMPLRRYYSASDNDEEDMDIPNRRRKPGNKGYNKRYKSFYGSWSKKRKDKDDDDDMEELSTPDQISAHFKTAGHQLNIINQKKYSHQTDGLGSTGSAYERPNSFQTQGPVKKSLGGKRSVSSKFVPPIRNNSQEESLTRRVYNEEANSEAETDPRLKNIEPRMIELIRNEIMDTGSSLGWDDIAGLHFAKATIQEIVVWPMLRPDIFTGLRRPPKGILLYGPPGTGKTLIGKCIASQSKSTFFSISASSLTSKWIGEGEKMVRALFAVARCHQPSVVFIDEIDSLLSQRSETEHESSRRIKTEFLVQLDGAATGEEDRILVIGATNRPQELDEAARRRLVKRLYIPLPDFEARKQLVENLMKNERNTLSPENIREISELTEGYSGADMKNLCQEACLGPIRSLPASCMFEISADQVRPVNMEDFKSALRRVRSSVSSQDLELYVKWDEQYGSGVNFS